MKRLYKIIFLFILIFLIGVYVAIKSINDSFSDEVTTEIISMNPSILKFKVIYSILD